MKALKEKRNSLRSLARMGLVILSVFTLAFAACRGTGNDVTNGTAPTQPTQPTDPTDPPPPARTVRSMTILHQPYTVHFEGMRPILDGIRVEVRYSDNSWEIISDPTQFYTAPYFLETGSVVFSDNSLTDAAVIPLGLQPTVSVVDLVTHTPGMGIIPPGGAAGGGDVDVLATDQWIQLFHINSGVVRAPFRLHVVRPLMQPVPGAIAADENLVGEPLHITGRLTQRAFFEDDLPNFDGVTVEAIFPRMDLRLDNNGGGFFAAGTAGGATPNIDLLPEALLRNHAAVRLPVPLDQARVDETHGPYWTGLRGNIDIPGFNANRQGTLDEADSIARTFFSTDGGITGNVQPSAANTIAFRFNNRRYLLPFDTFHQVVAVEVASINEAGWGDHFQFVNTPAGFDWVEEAFGRAGLRLRVFYGGTQQTREIGLAEFRRAQGRRFNVMEHGATSPLGRPGADNRGQGQQLGVIVTAPEMYLRDAEAVVARFGYFSKMRHEFTAHDVTLPPTNFPNQVIELQVPVWEFDREIRFQRRASWNPDHRLYVEGTNQTRAPGTNFEPMSRGLADSIRQAYELVAVYSRAGQERTRAINSFLFRSMPAAHAAAGLVNVDNFGSYQFGNLTNEPIELAVTWRFPGAGTGTSNIGHTSNPMAVPMLGSSAFIRNAAGAAAVAPPAADEATWMDPTPRAGQEMHSHWDGIDFGSTRVVEPADAGGPRTAGRNAREAFANLVAELEPEVLILPYHEWTP